MTETLDNSGSESTGVYQAGVTLSYDPYWAFNDLFYVTYSQAVVFDVHDRGSKSISAHYSVPYDYWLLSWNGGYNETFQTITGEIESYIYSGSSSNQSVELERTLYRNDRYKVAAHTTLKGNRSDSYINDVEIAVQHRQRRKLEVALDSQWFFGRATLDSSVIYNRGLPDFGASEDPEVKAGNGVENPEWLVLDLNYNRPAKFLGQQWLLDSQFKAQGNLTPLIPLDRMYIGSSTTVRGFEQGVSGESAAVWHNDLTYIVPASAQRVILGVDGGIVFDNEDALAGSSLGLKGALFGLTYEASASWPLLSPSNLDAKTAIYRFQLSKVF